MVETLMERTHRLLREDSRSLPDIFADLREQGSTITFYWLRKFSSGAFKDPSVNRVEELHQHLTGRPLLKAS